MNKPHALISVAAGRGQVPVIRKAKNLGLAVIGIDQNPRAPGFAYADECVVLSTYEPEPIIARLHKLVPRYDFEGVITSSSGPPVFTAACLAKAFNLPGISPETAKTITFKSQLMAACAKLGIPAPRHQAVHSLDEVNWTEIEYPCVIKPSLGLVGKFLIRAVYSPNELEAQFEQTLTAAWDGCVDIESFVPGCDVSLMAMVANRELLPVVLLDEVNTFDGNGYVKAKQLTVPSVFAGGIEEERIHQLARTIVEKIGVETTPFSMSCRCERGGQPKLIEIQLNLCGDAVLVESLSANPNFDFIELGIKIMTGQNPNLTRPVFWPPLTISE